MHKNLLSSQQSHVLQHISSILRWLVIGSQVTPAGTSRPLEEFISVGRRDTVTYLPSPPRSSNGKWNQFWRQDSTVQPVFVNQFRRRPQLPPPPSLDSGTLRLHLPYVWPRRATLARMSAKQIHRVMGGDTSKLDRGCARDLVVGEFLDLCLLSWKSDVPSSLRLTAPSRLRPWWPLRHTFWSPKLITPAISPFI